MWDENLSQDISDMFSLLDACFIYNEDYGRILRPDTSQEDPAKRAIRAKQESVRYHKKMAKRACAACGGKLSRPYRTLADCLSCGAKNHVPSTRGVRIPSIGVVAAKAA